MQVTNRMTKLDHPLHRKVAPAKISQNVQKASIDMKKASSIFANND